MTRTLDCDRGERGRLYDEYLKSSRDPTDNNYLSKVLNGTLNPGSCGRKRPREEYEQSEVDNPVAFASEEESEHSDSDAEDADVYEEEEYIGDSEPEEGEAVPLDYEDSYGTYEAELPDAQIVADDDDSELY